MNKRLYTLKRATPRMKYLHIRNLMEWKADCKDKQFEEVQRISDEMQDHFIQVRDELKMLDPDGWSQWYDEFVPDWKGWINCQPAIDCISKRVETLRSQRGPVGTKQADTARDVETITFVIKTDDEVAGLDITAALNNAGIAHTIISKTQGKAGQQSVPRTGFQPPHGHVFIGGKCECGEQVSLPPFVRR